MTKTQIEGSEFPIFRALPKPGKEAARKSLLNKKIGCVDPAAQSLIESMQPYGRVLHPLLLIHDLDRIDKHRSLTVCATLPTWSGEKIEVGGLDRPESNIRRVSWIRMATFTGPLKRDQILLRYAAEPIDPYREMQSQPISPLLITFPEGGVEGVISLYPVLKVLDSLCDFVRDEIMAPLAKFL